MKFDKLVISIQNTHEELQRSAVKAVNQSLTVRNWLIGLYIVEFKQKGEDRAKYEERLLPELSEAARIRGRFSKSCYIHLLKTKQIVL